MRLSGWGVALSLCLGMAGAGIAQEAGLSKEDLYRAETIVTGTGEQERTRGFRVGAEEVVIKLTGDPKLSGSARIKPILDRAADLVAEHSYEDRMKGIPIHDEQGTRDRPHYLRMRFDKAKMDEALATARLTRWTGERPVVAVWLGIREGRGRYVLSAEGPEGYGQREVLKEASKRRGVPILLPSPGQSTVTYEVIDKSVYHLMKQETAKLGADAILYGTLDFDGNVGWNTRWTMAGERAYAKWRMQGVSFDTALRSAIEKTAAAFAKSAKKAREER